MHPLVTQQHFARSEFARCFEGVPAEDACCRVGSMNCLSWTVGHLAWQEHALWVEMAQGSTIAPGLGELVGYRQPASTPPWDEMWRLWHVITKAADVYLERLTPEDLTAHLLWEGKPLEENVGVLLLRNIYHYWFHLGKAHATRQMLGHAGLPVYVGSMRDVRVALGEAQD
jgi:hypothetical protein